MPSDTPSRRSTQPPISDAKIQQAAFEFWGAISNAFPEVVDGDSALTDECEAAFAIWANGSPGDRSETLHKLPLPEGYADDRVAAAVSLGREAAAAKLFADATVPTCPQPTQDILIGCVHHMLYYNAPGPAPTGTFEVHAYETEEEWAAAKGASNIESGFESYEEALTFAGDSQFESMYQVTIRAEGEHEDYESGEEIYSRFDRDDPAIPRRTKISPR
jgi:hypothetical protein